MVCFLISFIGAIVYNKELGEILGWFRALIWCIIAFQFNENSN
jgi:hypothetical protein